MRELVKDLFPQHRTPPPDVRDPLEYWETPVKRPSIEYRVSPVERPQLKIQLPPRKQPPIEFRVSPRINPRPFLDKEPAKQRTSATGMFLFISGIVDVFLTLLGQEKYLQRVVERMINAIHPDDSEGEPPLLPILNRYRETGSTSEVNFMTTKPCVETQRSHINMVAADTNSWEQATFFRLEQAAQRGMIQTYVRNEQLGFTIPYEFYGINHH